MKKILVITALLLSGCATQQSDERYSIEHDKAPEATPTLDHIEDAQPRYEPYSRAGNKDYTVLGESYQVMKDPEDYVGEGIASWYGKKFHGHKTSNGEIYDMYSMSAAHKTLPLPSYVEVENLANGRKAIVRVNDRGPFHEGRIIDLSYAAASKLDVLKSGTAPVKVTLLKVDKPKDDNEWQGARNNRYFVQLVAISNQDKAKKAADTFSKQFELPTDIHQAGAVYRVRLGPFYDYDQTQKAALLAREKQISEAFVVVEPISDEPTPNSSVSN